MRSIELAHNVCSQIAIQPTKLMIETFKSMNTFTAVHFAEFLRVSVFVLAGLCVYRKQLVEY